MPSITILLLVLVNIVSGSHRVNTVLCYSSHGGGLGRELHCYDALTNTVKVVNIRNTTLGAYSYDNAHDDDSSLPEQLTVYNNKLYFVANEGTHGAELWVYDGTNTPTMVADIKQGSDGSYPVRPPTPIDRIPSRARACGCVWV